MGLRNELHTYLDTALGIELPELQPRPYRLRVSGLPYCGLKHLWQVHNPTPDAAQPGLGFAKEYFTSVGTTVHTALQRWVGRGSRIYGNWKCANLKCSGLIKFSAYKPCPVCGSETVYDEFEVKAFKHLSGHTDGLYKSRGNRWWVIDYKTSSMKVLDAHGVAPVLPYSGNKFQITSYVPLIERQFGIKVSGWALIYLSRDNPFKFRVISEPMTEAAKEARMLKLELFDTQYDRVLHASNAVGPKVVAWLVETKFCKSLEHYSRSMRGYNPCPLEAVCFTRNLTDVLHSGLRLK